MDNHSSSTLQAWCIFLICVSCNPSIGLFDWCEIVDQASLIYVDEYDQSEATAWEMACKEMLIPIGEFRRKKSY